MIKNITSFIILFMANTMTIQIHGSINEEAHAEIDFEIINPTELEKKHAYFIGKMKADKALQDYAINNQLLAYSKTIDTENIKRMIALEANVNYQDEDGNTPLHHLIQASVDNPSQTLPYAEARLYLSLYGAKMNIPNNNKITASDILWGKNIDDIDRPSRSIRWW